MKCRVCREPAVIDVRRHNAAFCRDHFLHHCDEQVARAIHSHKMLAPGERVLVAVSGGKDSLALWDILVRLGYEADGLYLGLGIGEYSDESVVYAREQAQRHRSAAPRDRPCDRLRLRHSRRRRRHARVRRAERAACRSATCSTRPRSNTATRWSPPGTTSTTKPRCCSATCCAGRPRTWAVSIRCCRQRPGSPRKVKPLVRLGERETAAYCVLRRIDYQVEECPMAAGNRHLGFKEMLNSLEERSPGTKAAFLFGFLERGHERFAADAEVERDDLRAVHGVRRAHARRRVRVLPTPREGDRRAREAGEVGEWRARSPPATACCSSTRSAAATSSPCRRVASSTRTRACSSTTR